MPMMRTAAWLARSAATSASGLPHEVRTWKTHSNGASPRAPVSAADSFSTGGSSETKKGGRADSESSGGLMAPPEERGAIGLCRPLSSASGDADAKMAHGVSLTRSASEVPV
eukprot:scaffold28547_cov35-Tisochrysis_lutea.AAC.2